MSVLNTTETVKSSKVTLQPGDIVLVTKASTTKFCGKVGIVTGPVLCGMFDVYVDIDFFHKGVAFNESELAIFDPYEYFQNTLSIGDTVQINTPSNVDVQNYHSYEGFTGVIAREYESGRTWDWYVSIPVGKNNTEVPFYSYELTKLY